MNIWQKKKKKAEAALLRRLNDVGAKELKRSRKVVQTAETFLLGVPFRRSGKGTVLIAIAGLHFPTGLDRISTLAFAFLKGRPEMTADVGNLWASQGGNRRTWKTNQGPCHALRLPTAKWLQKRKREGCGGRQERRKRSQQQVSNSSADVNDRSLSRGGHSQNPLVPQGAWRNFLSQ